MKPDNLVCHNVLRIVAAFILLFPFIEVEGAHLTPDQALQRVTGKSGMRRMPARVNYELSYTEKTEEGQDVLYVFNKGDNGFIVVSADDRMTALLGYSDEGAFDLETVPPELRWWLGQYAQEANYLFNHEEEFNINEDNPTRSGSTSTERVNIEPLIKTKWGQGFPYNLDCPIDKEGNRCVTGCVATAMAQIINYYKYPDHGIGEHSYTWDGYDWGNHSEVKGGSYNFAAASFEYNNMLDTYDAQATEKQKEAVANLMYACGVSINMMYTATESGATTCLIPYSLKRFFGYKDGHTLDREYYSNEEWEEIIYSELSAGKPLIYSGNNNHGGHVFICDGYEDGKFHFNWGWNGIGDGYYLLTAMNPPNSGTGYNTNHHIVAGLSTNTEPTSAFYPIYASSNLEFVNLDEENYLNVTLSDKGFIGNIDGDDINLKMFLKVVSETDSENIYIVDDIEGSEVFLHGLFVDAEYKEGENNKSWCDKLKLKIPSDVPEGSYKCYMVFKAENDDAFYDLPFPIASRNYLYMDINDQGDISFEKEKLDLVFLSVNNENKVNTIGNKGEHLYIYYKFKNIGNQKYEGKISYKIINKDNNKTVWNPGSFEITYFYDSYSSLYTSYISVLSYIQSFEVGEYKVVFYDKNGDIIGEEFSFKIIEPVTGITLDKTEAKLTEGETLQLTATVEPEDATDKSIVWTSSDEKVATVDEKGLVTAVSAGTATITATYSGASNLSAECVVTVEAKVIPATGISITTENTDKEGKIIVGETLQLTVSIEPEDATDKSVVWSSSDEKVATMDENGLVTAVSAGTVTITATCSGSSDLKANFVITVEAGIIEAAGISLNAVEVTATEGEEFNLYATVTPENAAVKTVKWGSSDPEIAQVNENGKVTAIKPGEAVITAITANGFTASCNVTVKKRIIVASSISLNYLEASITEGNTIALNVSFDPSTTTDQTIVWTTSDAEIAIVDAEGVVTALHPGNAVITATTVNGVTANCNVTVEKREIIAERISLNVTDAIVEVGNSILLILSFEPELTTNKTVAWSSSNPEVASVDENGGVLAIMPGKTVITATASNGLTATCDITVEEREYEITEIFLNVTEATMTEEDKLALDIFVYPTIAAGKKVTWSSSDPEIAAVDENGLVTAIKEGTATITVSAENGVSAGCKIIVIRRFIEPTGIGMDPAHKSVTPGDTFTITATISPDDASDKTIIWSSSDEKVATVDEYGFVTPVSPGVAIITASTINGISVECTVEVLEKVSEPEIILVSSVAFDDESNDRLKKSIYVGDTFKLSVVILPEEATDKSIEWISSNPEIASVDSEGNVSILAIGEVLISAKTKDGSNLKTEYSLMAMSGIESILKDCEQADVYTVNGILIKKSADRDFISALEKGIYIMIVNGTTYKFVK